MSESLGTLYSWFAFVPKITFLNVVEILILAFLFYKILSWAQSTRAWILLRGAFIILAFYFLAALLNFTTITWIITHIGSIAVIALVIVFQPELRRALEQLGSSNWLKALLGVRDDDSMTGFTDNTANEIARAAFEMGKVKTGALIVVEKGIQLTEIENTGIEIDGLVTSQLLINIFEKNTPLHDGAVLIRGNRVVAATCYLPLSDNLSISKDLGTRHRAGLGISETSDSMTVIVSEENGTVSLAYEGTITRIDDPETLRARLHPSAPGKEHERFRFIKDMKGIFKHETKTE